MKKAIELWLENGKTFVVGENCKKISLDDCGYAEVVFSYNPKRFVDIHPTKICLVIWEKGS